MTSQTKMASPTVMEFAVQMTCGGCEKSVRKALEGIDGINNIKINLDSEQVIVESTLPSSTVKSLIEKTGKSAVLQGHGPSSYSPGHMGAAVAMLEAGSNMAKGVIRMVQTNESTCVIDGTVDGLPPGKHSLFIHECGDITDGCKSCGDIFGKQGPLTKKVAGAIGDILTTEGGRAEFRMVNNNLKIWELIGRSAIIHTDNTDNVLKKNDTENRIVCGIIARSAGLFQNTKKICACDGVTIWDERNKPLAGEGRKSKI